MATLEADTAAHPVREAVLAQLESGPEGLSLPRAGRAHLAVLVEIAAGHPDEQAGIRALLDILRVALALEQQQAPAGPDIQALFTQSRAALRLLDRHRSGAATREKMAKAMGDRPAPKMSTVKPTSGVSLEDLDGFKRFDLDAARARRR